MKKIILLLCCIPLLMATSCENHDDNQIVCTTEFVYGLNVTVIDSQTEQPITDGVIVTAVDGSYSETLVAFPGNENVFVGAGERPGTYIITVAKDGYTTFTSNPLVVAANVCHVTPVQITVSLISN